MRYPRHARIPPQAGSDLDLRGRRLLANLDSNLSQPQTAEQPTTTPRQISLPRGGSYDFLIGNLIDEPTLDRAELLALEWQVSVPRALAALGWVGEADYVRALADHLGVRPVGAGLSLHAVSEMPQSRLMAATVNGVPNLVADGFVLPPEALRVFVSDAAARGYGVLLATPAEVDSLRLGPSRAWRLDAAIHGLGSLDRHLSAAAPMATWQKLVLPLLAGLTLAAVAMAPAATIPVLLALLTVPFLCVALIRLAGWRELRRDTRAGPGLQPIAPRHGDDATLPIYSIMVPLHDEAEVLPRLMRALTTLDYPAARLDIVLVLEEADAKTRNAAVALDLPGNVRTIVVPAGGPQTKPKACNFALGLVHGEYVVVYDAEDRPEASQLRLALDRFADDDATLACVQARLNTYNADAGFLTRQFSIEYTVLFDAILPALERLGLPLPLGGTSNHFRVAALRAIGAWDPYNVTEDADLGIRLARRGFRTATIASTTWEEAPEELGNWWRQRTRWLKGWMQTYLVHMRRPWQLKRELGLKAFLGLQVLMGGILISVLGHPFIYVLVGYEAWSGHLMAAPETAGDVALLVFATVSLALGLISSMGVGMAAVVQRRRPWLAPWALAMPLYWLLISFAGYRALIQLVRQPFLWEKTRHGAATEDPSERHSGG